MLSTLFKYFALGVYTVCVADIVVNRALNKTEARANDLIDKAVDRSLLKANNFVDSAVDQAVDLAIDRLESNTGLPFYPKNRRPWIDTLIRTGQKEDC